MAEDHRRAGDMLAAALRTGSAEELAERLAPKPGPAVRLRLDPAATADGLEARWALLGATGPEVRRALADADTVAGLQAYRANVENVIGTVKVPVGLAGPLRVNGIFAQGDYWVPLATTEAALVASYSRGAQLLTAAGGATAAVLNEGIGRAPGFAFADLVEAGRFVQWALAGVETFRAVAATTTRHGRLADLGVHVEGNHVYLAFHFDTADAAGQNMATLATEAICAHIAAHSPVRPAYWFLEANFSGDKKASAQSFVHVRGRKATAEARLPAALVRRHLHTTPARMADYWRMSALGGVMSGTMGVQGHFANGLAALYIATGQDAACVAESAVGVTRLELDEDGALYAAVTLPNLVVGTVGGGTGLPAQRACLEILGLAGAGKARALAELCAALCLAGELSIIGALCAGQFARAHRSLARGRGDG